jgi:hypothetical protein
LENLASGVGLKGPQNPPAQAWKRVGDHLLPGAASRRPHRHRPASTENGRKPAGFPRGFNSRETNLDESSSECNRPCPADRGAGPCWARPHPLARPGTTPRTGCLPGRSVLGVGAFWQSGGWSHTNYTHPRGVEAGRTWFGRLRSHAFRVSGNSPLQYSRKTALPDVKSRGPCQRTLTDLFFRGSEPAAASRDAGPEPVRGLGENARRSVADASHVVPGRSWNHGEKRRSDRRGQAPKGTGGMPRRHQNSGVEGCDKSGGAAQRASSPEFPSNPGN